MKILLFMPFLLTSVTSQITDHTHLARYVPRSLEPVLPPFKGDRMKQRNLDNQSNKIILHRRKNTSPPPSRTNSPPREAGRPAAGIPTAGLQQAGQQSNQQAQQPLFQPPQGNPSQSLSERIAALVRLPAGHAAQAQAISELEQVQADLQSARARAGSRIMRHNYQGGPVPPGRDGFPSQRGSGSHSGS